MKEHRACDRRCRMNGGGTMEVPVLVAKRLDRAPNLKGEIEAEWPGATIFDDFKLRGGQLTQKTRAYLGYDEEALYLAFVMQEERVGELRTDTTARTRKITVRPWMNEDDSIQVLIDPQRDGVNYMHFLVNPAGKWMTSRGMASPDRLECDYQWTPQGWEFHTTVEKNAWTLRMKIPVTDLGLEKLAEGEQLGLNFIRERTPQPHETSFFTGDTMSWTTQWTSHVSYESAEFGVLALGRITEKPQAFDVPQWPGPARPEPVKGVRFLPAVKVDGARQRKLPILIDRDCWWIHPPIEAFRGLEKSRLALFAPSFGWRLVREVTTDIDLQLPQGKEWTWWFYGFDKEKLESESWSFGLSEEKLARSVLFIHWRRYCEGTHLPPFRKENPIVRKGFEQLIKKFGDRFLGFIHAEWDSDIWSAATGMKEADIWDEYPEEMPKAVPDRQEEEKILRHEWSLFKKLSYNYIFGESCWRCVEHYGLEWGGRCALIELSENGNPSMLTQMAFARGAARQYRKFFATYQATMMGTGYTDYTPLKQYDENVETVWATGPHFGPSKELYRRLLFTSYLSGATVMMFEAPQWVHVMQGEREGEYVLSPHGEVFAGLLEYDGKYEDRGVPYQPVALLLDYLHGFSPPYQTNCAVGRSGMQTWFSTPYERGDHQVYQTFWTIFPWCRQRIERHGYPLTNTPFGNIFDVLVANPPSGVVTREVLESYRVAFLVGTIRFSQDLKARLLDYVKGGGTLVANALHASELPEELKGGEVLFDSGGVKVTAKDVGAGRVITTPDSDLLDEENKALPVLGEILATMAQEICPIKVKGDVQYHFLKTKNGWLVALLNNKGIVHHPRQKPEYRSQEKAEVELIYDGAIEKSIDRLSGESINWETQEGKLAARLSVEPGGMRIIEMA